jgi:hypothetical protein
MCYPALVFHDMTNNAPAACDLATAFPPSTFTTLSVHIHYIYDMHFIVAGSHAARTSWNKCTVTVGDTRLLVADDRGSVRSAAVADIMVVAVNTEGVAKTCFCFGDSVRNYSHNHNISHSRTPYTASVVCHQEPGIPQRNHRSAAKVHIMYVVHVQ